MNKLNKRYLAAMPNYMRVHFENVLNDVIGLNFKVKELQGLVNAAELKERELDRHVTVLKRRIVELESQIRER